MKTFQCIVVVLSILLPFNGFADPGSGLPERRPLGADLPINMRAVVAENSTEFPTLNPCAELTLEQALSLALSRNHELSAFSWEFEAHQGMLQQAGVLPNPELGLEVENILGEDENRSFKSAETTLQLSQLFELGGKRVSRYEIAKLERDLAGWDYETTRLNIITSVNDAFFELLSVQEQVQLGKENLQLAEDVLSTVDFRVEAGKASPLERRRAQMVVSKNRIALGSYTRKLTASRKHLASTWGADNPHFIKITGDFVRVNEPPAWETIIERLNQNPEIARQKTEINLQNARLDLAQATGVPDMVVGGGIKRHEDNNNYTFLFGVSMALPVFDRNKGGISAAKSKIISKRSENQAAELKLKTALSLSYEELQAAFVEVNSLQNMILPEAEETFAAINFGYRHGQFEFLEVLDAQRTLIELREQLIDSMQSYHDRRINLEHLIAQEIVLTK